MSREQWGHGYHRGREDERKNPEGYRFIGFYGEYEREPYLNSLAYIHEKRQNTYVIEWIDYFELMLAISFGYQLDFSEEAIVYEQMDEITEDELKERNVRFFYSWNTVVGENIKAEKVMNRKYSQNKVV